MNFRITFLTMCVAAAAAALASLPADAAMPVASVSASSNDGLVMEVAQRRRSAKRRSELDRSVDQGTVPARYRSRVPREYQQYIPFERGR